MIPPTPYEHDIEENKKTDDSILPHDIPTSILNTYSRNHLVVVFELRRIRIICRNEYKLLSQTQSQPSGSRQDHKGSK